MAEHKIPTRETTLIASAPYRMTDSQEEDIVGEIQIMLNLGVIVPSESVWSAPVVLVQKPDHTIRFCVDYRKLNKVTCR